MLFISALELVQMCQKHGILIGTDCVIHSAMSREPGRDDDMPGWLWN